MCKKSAIKYGAWSAILGAHQIVSASNYTSNIFRDEKKDKSWDFALEWTSISFVDFQNNEPTFSLNATKLRTELDKNKPKHPMNPKHMDSYMSAEFFASKQFFLLVQNKLAISLSRAFGDDKLEFARYYWEMDLENGMTIKIGKDNGNFGSHIRQDMRYAAHQIAFNHKFSNGFKYTIAIEEAQKISTDKDGKDDELVEKQVTDIGGKPVKINSKDEKKTDKSWRTSETIPKLAFVANAAYAVPKCFEIGINTLATYGEYYQSTKAKENSIDNSYKPQFLFAGCLYAKYVTMYSEDYVRGEKSIIKAHGKFRSGCLGYNAEAGGLGKATDSNVVFDSALDTVEPIQTVAFGIEVKHFWTPIFYSKVGGDAIMAVATNLDSIKEENRITDAVKIKAIPFALQLGEIFGLEPAYVMVAKNGFADMGHRIEVAIGLGI